jgi:hypothetical protein
VERPPRQLEGLRAAYEIGRGHWRGANHREERGRWRGGGGEGEGVVDGLQLLGVDALQLLGVDALQPLAAATEGRNDGIGGGGGGGAGVLG